MVKIRRKSRRIYEGGSNLASIQKIEGKRGVSYRIRVGAGYDDDGK
jgi:hypothetical protein